MITTAQTPQEYLAARRTPVQVAMDLYDDTPRNQRPEPHQEAYLMAVDMIRREASQSRWAYAQAHKGDREAIDAFVHLSTRQEEADLRAALATYDATCEELG